MMLALVINPRWKQSIVDPTVSESYPKSSACRMTFINHESALKRFRQTYDPGNPLAGISHSAFDLQMQPSLSQGFGSGFGSAGVSPVTLWAFTPHAPTGGTPALPKQVLPR
jgi:hypothetical protein